MVLQIKIDSKAFFLKKKNQNQVGVEAKAPNGIEK